jgi:RND family efflux transporter MFP subunit
MAYKKYCPIILLTLTLSVILSLSACKPKTREVPEEVVIPVDTTQVKPITSGSELTVSGNIEGNKTVRIGFMVTGKINYIAAQEGQSVSNGQLVASLDPVNYSIAKQMADVQVNQAQDEYNRLKILHERNSLSESDFKKIGFTLDQAKAQQRQQAQNLIYTRLHAPLSGVLLKKMAETGEIVATGTPILVISDISKVKVNAYVPENDLHAIRLGQSAAIEIAAIDKTYTGKVTEVGSAADPSSRAFTIKIELPNPGWFIRPGMIAEVKLTGNDQKEMLTVPATSVLRDTDGQSYVYVADLKKGKAFKRKVSPGQLIDSQIEITTGLTAGETIVSGGQNKLSDGSTISISK